MQTEPCASPGKRSSIVLHLGNLLTISNYIRFSNRMKLKSGLLNSGNLSRNDRFESTFV